MKLSLQGNHSSSATYARIYAIYAQTYEFGNTSEERKALTRPGALSTEEVKTHII